MNRLFFLMIISCCGLALSSPVFAFESARSGVPSGQVKEGITLYEEYCANCHQSFAKTTKPHRSIGRLRSSIEHFAVMNNLDFLNDEQLEALASALRTIPLKAASLNK